ncbi:LOW QUALITY PROTEIN: hypothetical protein HID58_046550 [Brassica napus]|uniref:FBD domain-containing protein n=1 Tax=Brassica napus TaxID=3708 RepID=A0ABQ8AWW2_BRANA|nr:LOW QUALITY PROTEIN: hypothetical protein HID58_046550 [Brassica napus]
MSGLSDDLLVKILSFVPTKVAVSTSVLSKRWECLWMWVPTFEDINTDIKDRYRVSVHKNLLSHRAPIIESLRLKFCLGSLQPEDIKQWVVSRCVRVLSTTLVTLKLEGNKILVDVPPTVCLPSLATLQLLCVTYFDEASLRMLLSNCPVLEDLVIERDTADDNAKGLVVVVPSLQRLSLQIDGGCCSYDGYVIDTPSLMYFKDYRDRDGFFYLIKDMPKLEEADIAVKYGLQEFLESVTSVKRLSIIVLFNNEEESMYCSCIVFNQLQRLKLSICNDDWSNLGINALTSTSYERTSWDNEWSVTPNCLLKTLETFEFSGCKGRPQERAFLSFFFTNARCLKSTSILR